MEEPDRFLLESPWPPSGDQPQAIEALARGVELGHRFQTLLGVTGSGKTFTIAALAARLHRPVLVLAHNKTLAAQLYSEFRGFFPHNAVHYFVSYYDYYQPEAYVPAQDLYIEKDASVNDRIEKLRLATTKALLERRDVVVVASVSCIYGLGQRKSYEDAVFSFAVGDRWERRAFLERLMQNYYERNDVAFSPGLFRVRGDVLEIYPAYSDTALRVAFFDDEVERIDEIEPVSGQRVLSKMKASIFPAKHYVTGPDAIKNAMEHILADMENQAAKFQREGKLLEAQRLVTRTRYDMEMLTEVGYCSGIENYSVYLDGRSPGDPPGTLLDFFPKDFLMVIDESHISVPQVRGMYNGDRSRKEVLVDYGFRLPSAMDNRPLRWEEFEEYMHQVIFVSATPGDWEIAQSSQVVEQIVRPTGVVDPEILVLPARSQVDDLVGRLKDVVERGERALVTALTKRSSEDLAEYLGDLGFKSKYIHSELDAFERAELIRDLRLGRIDVLVGVNLLREGIDLPEVSLVAILDADREGFLRSERSLVQIIGRAARNVAGVVILYADQDTGSIQRAVAETDRRRKIQQEYNEKHHITPQSVRKGVGHLLPEELLEKGTEGSEESDEIMPRETLERMMWEAVERLDFERAAQLRDQLAGKKKGAILRVASPRRARRARA